MHCVCVYVRLSLPSNQSVSLFTLLQYAHVNEEGNSQQIQQLSHETMTTVDKTMWSRSNEA